MDLDRQSIEKRDFPIGRRGYDPAAVDSHLRTLASEIEELQRTAGSRGSGSLGSTAGTQVQSILEAAETTAAEIERSASDHAQQVREAAARDAEQTREQAVARARAHVEAVAQATAVLLGRVESMDEEVGGLVESLRAGAGRLAADLAAVETNMGELYDAASGQISSAPSPAAGGTWGESAAYEPQAPSPGSASTPHASPTGPAPAGPGADESLASGAPAQTAAPVFVTAVARPAAARPAPSQARAPMPGNGAAQQAPAPGGDLDGARLIALNMALNGESRVQTDRYLAENFELSDRAKLLDEVYAAIEG